MTQEVESHDDFILKVIDQGQKLIDSKPKKVEKFGEIVSILIQMRDTLIKSIKDRLITQHFQYANVHFHTHLP